jgi:hypothetical protein
MLDRAVLTGCIHRLEDEQHGPFVLGVELVLQFGERLHAHGQGLFESRFVFTCKLKRVARVDVLKPKVFAFGDAERIGNSSGCFDDLFCFHNGCLARY